MANIKFKLNSAGVRELLKSGEMAAECGKYAQQIASSAGNGYVTESRSYPERIGVVVYAGTPEAARDNLKNNTLLKAMGGAGG